MYVSLEALYKIPFSTSCVHLTHFSKISCQSSPIIYVRVGEVVSLILAFLQKFDVHFLFFCAYFVCTAIPYFLVLIFRIILDTNDR